MPHIDTTEPTERLAQLTVALTALRLLMREPVQVEPLAEAVGLGRRTIYRLLEALEGVGIPIQRAREGRDVFLSVRRHDVERALGLEVGGSGETIRGLVDEVERLRAELARR